MDHLGIPLTKRKLILNLYSLLHKFTNNCESNRDIDDSTWHSA